MNAEISTGKEFRLRGVPTLLENWSEDELRQGLFELRERSQQVPSDQTDECIAIFEEEIDKRDKQKG